MMDAIREYVVHVTATSLLCAVLFRIFPRDGGVKMIMKLLCGIVLACSILQPVKQIDFSVMEDFAAGVGAEAEEAVAEGKKLTATAWAESITQGLEEYILEKTKTMNVNLIVEVELSDEELPMPVGVTLVGEVAPYTKSVITDIIERDLNIPKEHQIWISR